MKTIKPTIILSVILSTVCLINCRKETIKETEKEVIIKSEEIFIDSICGTSNQYFKYKFLRKVENVSSKVVATQPNSFGKRFFYIKLISNDKISYLTPCNFSEEFKIDGLDIIISANLYNLECKTKQCPNGYFFDSELISIEKQ